MKKRLMVISIICLIILICSGCVSTKTDEPNSMKAPTEPQEGVIVVNDNTIGDGLNQFEYKPDWNYAPGDDPKYEYDDHYIGQINAYFQVRFNGTNIKVYGTKDAHHGDAYASIDGGEEVKVTYKDMTRDFQMLIFDSGPLKKGEHILKIRVAGTGVVTADRVDITE